MLILSLYTLYGKKTKELAEVSGTSDTGNMTVSDFVEKYIDTHNTLRESTVNQYRGALNILKKYPFCRKKISEVSVTDAKKYALELSKTRSYGTTQTDLIVLKAAFSEAVEDGILKSNPFSFKLSKLIVNSTVPKSSINNEDRVTMISVEMELCLRIEHLHQNCRKYLRRSRNLYIG